MENKLEKLSKLADLCRLRHFMMKNNEILNYAYQICDLIEADFSEPGFVKEKLRETERMSHINVLVNNFSKKYGEVNFKPFQRPDGSYGLCAKNKIDPGTFVKVPYEEIFCLEKFCKESEYQHIFKNYQTKIMGNCLFTVIILLEFYRMEKSEYHEYLMSLPSTFGNIVEFEREHFRLLSYTELFRETVETWSCLVEQYAHLHMCIIDWLTKAPYELKRLLKSIDITKKFCLKDYMWAIGIFLTRNFPYNQKGEISICLVPIIDLCNHNDNALPPSFSSLPTKFFADTKTPIMSGEEIFIKYSGGLNGFESLIIHGFVNLMNEGQFSTLVFPYRSADKLASFKHQFMLTYTQASLCSLIICERDWWQGNNTQRLRIFAANTEELEFLKGLSKKELESLLRYQKAYNQRNENMCFFLLSHKFKEVFANLDKLEDITKSQESKFAKYLQIAANAEKKVVLKAMHWLIDAFPEYEDIFN